MSEIKKRIRCAVYTRKSHEEGLEQEFNSLDAQREACENYVMAQRTQGWMLVPDLYDDGGFSGGNTERPALQRLLADIRAKRVDMVVVYKIDRLSRSLLDFLKMLDVFETHGVAFVSVTQHFDTSTSMGKLMLNVLLSFAQFEREITGERIRDKIAASKRKGLWMGGPPPFGYDCKDRRLVINEAEAAVVRRIFQRFAILESITGVVKELRSDGVRTKTYVTQSGREKHGRLMDKGFVYKLMANRVYLGEIVHKGQPYPGQHEAIITQEIWDRAKAITAIHPHVRSNSQRRKIPAMLRSVIRCSGCHCAMTPYHVRKKGKLYRYYTPNGILKHSCESCPVGSIPAGEIETVVLGQLKEIFRAPEMLIRTWEMVKEHEPNIKESQIRETLSDIDKVWDELFPAEQERIVRLLVECVIVGRDSVDLRIRASGIGTLVHHVNTLKPEEVA